MSSGCQWSGDEIREYRGGGCVNVIRWTVEKFGMAAVDRCFGWNSRLVFTSTVNRYSPNNPVVYRGIAISMMEKWCWKATLYIWISFKRTPRSRKFSKMSNIMSHARKNKFLDPLSCNIDAKRVVFDVYRVPSSIIDKARYFFTACVPTPVCTFRIT